MMDVSIYSTRSLTLGLEGLWAELETQQIISSKLNSLDYEPYYKSTIFVCV